MIRGKKGTLFDFIRIIPIIFIAAIMSILVILAFNKIDDSGIFDGSPASVTIASQFRDNTVGTLDIFIIAAFIGLFLSTITLAFALPTNPSLFWINIILLTAIVIFSVVLSNAYEAFFNSSVFTGVTQPITAFFFSNLPLITSVYAIVLVVVMLGIKNVGGGI